MFSDNAIWFRETRAVQGRIKRHPVAARLRPFTLLLTWMTVSVATFLICMCSRSGSWSSYAWRDWISATLVCGLVVEVTYLLFRSLVAGAASLARERELQTLDTLLASPLPLRSLVAGKWLAATLPILMEMALALPFTILIMVTYALLSPAEVELGLGAWLFGDFALFGVLIVVLGTSAGMYVSSRAENTGKASLRSTMLGLALILGTYLIDVLLAWSASVSIPFVSVLNPFWALLAIGESTSLYNHNPHTWFITCGVYVASAAVFCVATVRKLQGAIRA